MFTWVYLRLSGLLLAVLVGVHLLGAFLHVTRLQGAATHWLVNGGMVVLVVSHGLIGLANVIRDQGLAPRGRVVLAWTLGVTGVVLAAGAFRALARFGML